MTAHHTVNAPAKINLGLEITGKRADGFHDIKSILCAISLHDTLSFAPANGQHDEVIFQGADVALANDDNLIIRALDAIRGAGVPVGSQMVTVDKRIPASAGLGGASSDAAATLLAFDPELESVNGDIFGISASLGSDVPFFLGGPIALVSGRGERIDALTLPHQAYWVILVTPRLTIPNKTATMYRAVESGWWSSGSAVETFAARLPELAPIVPPNTFERALFKRHPQLKMLRQALLDAGFPFVALTGAGPTFFTIVPSVERAVALAQAVRNPSCSVAIATLGRGDTPSEVPGSP